MHVCARGSGYTSPNPWAHFRIWKHPMRSQSGVYWNNEVAKEFMYFKLICGLVCAVCFQDLLQQQEILLTFTYCTSSCCWVTYFWKQDSQSCHRTSNHWRACRSSALCAVSTSNLSNRKVQRIQLLASSIVPTVWRYILWWDSLFNLHSYTYNCRASELPLAQEIGLV